MSVKTFVKRLLIAFLFLAAFLITFLFSCNAIVVNYAKGRLLTCVDSVPATDVALVLGTSPTSRITGKTNYFYEYRMDAAAELYKAGRVKRILVSGDAHSHQDVDETISMQHSLEERGVPTANILLDPEGTSTENSIKNAHDSFALRSFVVVSQHFHDERAIYLTDHLGLKFEKVVAYEAQSPDSALSYITYAREYFARAKMFLSLLFTKK